MKGKGTFSSRIAHFIGYHNLMKPDGKYIVALSGGADSTAMTLVLKELGYSIEAAHCNFRLRGGEADRDEKFCEEMCHSIGIPLHKAHFDTREYAVHHDVSIEMAARELRYSYLEQLRNDIKADAVCVAHHCEDSAETVLINLIRGTGIEGLAGIQPVNGNIVRPLLCVSREDIIDYLNTKEQRYVADSSNADNNLIRNKIRNEIIPILRTINPSVCNSVSRTAERVSAAIPVFRYAMKRSATLITSHENGAVIIDIERLENLPSPEYTLYYILKDYGFSPAQIKEIYGNIAAETGTEYISRTHDLIINRGTIIIEPLDETGRICMKIPEEGIYAVNSRLKIKVERILRAKDFTIERKRDKCNIDACGVVFPLILRNVRAGDRFAPFGMNGKKLVSDYMTDRKMNLFEKRRQLVIQDACGRILWLVGQCPDNGVRVTCGTEAVIRLSVIREVNGVT